MGGNGRQSALDRLVVTIEPSYGEDTDVDDDDGIVIEIDKEEFGGLRGDTSQGMAFVSEADIASVVVAEPAIRAESVSDSVAEVLAVDDGAGDIDFDSWMLELLEVNDAGSGDVEEIGLDVPILGRSGSASISGPIFLDEEVRGLFDDDDEVSELIDGVNLDVSPRKGDVTLDFRYDELGGDTEGVVPDLVPESPVDSTGGTFDNLDVLTVKVPDWFRVGDDEISGPVDVPDGGVEPRNGDVTLDFGYNPLGRDEVRTDSVSVTPVDSTTAWDLGVNGVPENFRVIPRPGSEDDFFPTVHEEEVALGAGIIELAGEVSSTIPDGIPATVNAVPSSDVTLSVHQSRFSGWKKWVFGVPAFAAVLVAGAMVICLGDDNNDDDFVESAPVGEIDTGTTNVSIADTIHEVNAEIPVADEEDGFVFDDDDFEEDDGDELEIDDLVEVELPGYVQAVMELGPDANLNDFAGTFGFRKRVGGEPISDYFVRLGSSLGLDRLELHGVAYHDTDFAQPIVTGTPDVLREMMGAALESEDYIKYLYLRCLLARSVERPTGSIAIGAYGQVDGVVGLQ